MTTPHLLSRVRSLGIQVSNRQRAGAIVGLGLVVTAVVLSVYLFLGGNAAVLTMLVIIATAVIAFTLVGPVRLLPALALTLAVLISSLTLRAVGGSLLAAIHPAAIVMIIWALRSFRPRHRGGGPFAVGSSPAQRFLGAIVAVALPIQVLFSIDPALSAAWSASFLVTCILPLFVQTSNSALVALEKTWIALGSGLGLVAALELATRTNPILEYVLARLDATSNVWAVFRSQVTFGHPITAGMFFAAASLLALNELLRRRSGAWLWKLVPLAFSLLGLLSTSTRSALAVFAAGAFCLVLIRMTADPARTWVRVLIMVIASIPALIVLNPAESLLARLTSEEAARSAGGRTDVLPIASQTMASRSLLGSGPGTSGEAISMFNPLGLQLENIVLGLMVSVGVITGAIICLLILLSIFAGLKNSLLTPIAVLVLVGCFMAYNGFEASYDTHVWLGAALLMCRYRSEKRIAQHAAGRVLEARSP